MLPLSPTQVYASTDAMHIALCMLNLRHPLGMAQPAGLLGRNVFIV